MSETVVWRDRTGDHFCASCGYGVSVGNDLPVLCPMCRGVDWVRRSSILENVLSGDRQAHAGLGGRRPRGGRGYA